MLSPTATSCHRLLSLALLCSEHFKMESFYKRWLRSDSKINNSVRKTSSDISEQVADSNEPEVSVVETPSDITYENDTFKLIVEKGFHKRQKRFRLEDHMFYFKVVPKNSKSQLPKLSDILDFLHAGFLHLLDSIKTFYEPNDKNIAYLTLFQEPMINGLNTGKCLIKSIVC